MKPWLLSAALALIFADIVGLDLGRTFDLVMIHDAIMYLTDRESLLAALATAYRHCRPGGAVVILPDCVRETFEPQTDHGGEDGPDGRGLRYLEWDWDPNPADTTFETAWAFLFRDEHGAVTTDMDHHQFGVFPRAAWFDALRAAGLVATSRVDPWKRDIFVARRPSTPPV